MHRLSREVALLGHFWRLRFTGPWFLTHFSVFGRYRSTALGYPEFRDAPHSPPSPLHFEVNTAEPQGRRPVLSWGGRGGGGESWPGGNKSKFLQNDLTGNDRVSAPFRLTRPPLGERARAGQREKSFHSRSHARAP